MISPREESAMPAGQEPVGDKRRKDTATDELDPMLRQIGLDLNSVIAAVKRTAFVEIQRAKLKAVDGIFRGALYLLALIAGMTLAVNAVVFIASGLRGALAAATGNEWLSEILLGVIFLAALLWAGWLVRSKLHSSLVRVTRERLSTTTPMTNGHSKSAGHLG